MTSVTNVSPPDDDDADIMIDVDHDDHYDYQCDDYNTHHDDARGSPANTPPRVTSSVPA